MSATSGIPIHNDLQQAFAAAQHSDHRFLKLAIRNELIVLDSTTTVQGDFFTDLDLLQDILEDDVPAYVLAKLDDSPSQWLAITYVPDTAKVRDKMLYASTRAALTKSLGSASFSDSLFATHKSDITARSYVAHRQHQNAPKPLSAREQVMADVQAAERATVRFSSEGSTARKNHLGGAQMQIGWDEDLQDAVRAVASNDEGSRLVVLSIDPSTETLVLLSNTECAPNDIGASLPPSDPAFAFFVWSHAHRRDTVFIYSCPSTSAIKRRMIFSSSVLTVVMGANNIGVPVAKRIETSDPQDINEAFLRVELGLAGGATEVETEGKKPFAKPRGPSRKQR